MTKGKQSNFLILILAIGVFGILSTEMGVIGILPVIADHYQISVSKAGLLVSLFALVVAISGPIMPVLFSRFNRKKVMVLVLGIFIIGNIIPLFTSNFTLVLLGRVVPAFFHPIYISLALTIAATSVNPEEASKAVSKIIMAVSAGMILGVPIASFIANATSLLWAMSFFAIVNAIAFITTLFFIPSMPVKERMSYGAQVRVLQKPILWLSLVTVISINAAVSEVYSYIANYLETFANISGEKLSFILFLFGIASLGGNIIAGKLLAKHAKKSIILYPIILGIAYVIAFLLTNYIGPIAIAIVLIWGVLFAIGNNIGQYWISTAAPEAPEFANGLFLTCGNLGITIGTSVGGFIISGMSTEYILLGGVFFLLLSLGSILVRNIRYRTAQ